MIRNLLASSPDAIHPGHARDHVAGARPTAADTFAALYRLQALRRDRRARLRRYRRAGAADRADRLFDRAGAGQPDRTQLPARHLHQFRQPARPLRPRAAGGDAGPTEFRSASRCWRRPARTRCSPSIGRVFHADTKLTLGARGVPHAAAWPMLNLRLDRRRNRRSPWSARIFPAWRSTANCRRSAAACWRRPRPRPTTGSMRFATTPPKPGMLRVEAGNGTSIEIELWALPAVGLRQFRRRDSAAAVDRHGAPDRRPRRQGLYRRSRRHRRRARHFRFGGWRAFVAKAAT